MAPIRQHFRIIGAIPFVDIDVETDTKQFIDPFRIFRTVPANPYSAKADELIRDYSSLLCSRIISASPVERKLAREMLQHLNEPRETRLGMSKKGFHGRGVDTFFGDKIADALRGDLRALVAVGVFNWIGTLPLFLENFDADRMSDVTTAIVRDSLIDFTQDMLARYPEFSSNGHSLVSHTLKVWDLNAQQWIDRTAMLPHADGHPILLVPESWVGNGIQLRGQRFYEVPVLGFVQKQHIQDNPQAPKVTKASLSKIPPYSNVYPTNLTMTLLAMQEGIDLLDQLLRHATRWLDDQEAA